MPLTCTPVASSSRLRPVAFRAVGWLAVVCVFGVGALQAALPQFFTSRQVIDQNFNLVDDSWKLEFSDKLAHGLIAGRDFYFNYGPIHQILDGGAGVLAGGGIASLLRYQRVLLILAELATVWLTIALVVERMSWRLPLFLLWVIFFPVRTLKPFGAIAAVTLLLAAEQSRRRWLLALAALLPGLVFLYSVDLGVFGLLTLAIVSAVRLLHAACRGHIITQLKQVLMLWVCIAADAVVLAAGVQLCFQFPVIEYLFTALEIARGYATMMVLPLDDSQAWWLLGGLAIALATLMALLILERPDRPRVERGMAIAAFAVLWLRYALTRSDVSHVYASLLPCLVLLLVVIPGLLAPRAPRLAALAALLWLPVVIYDPFAVATRIQNSVITRPSRAAGQVEQPPGPVESRPGALARKLVELCHFDWRRPVVSVTSPTVIEALSVVDENGLRGRPFLCWPTETVVNVLAGSPNVNPLLQSYVAHTPTLERKVIARLDRAPQAPVLLIREEPAVDVISNVVRTPLIFRYLLDHYELKGPGAGNVVLLRRTSAARGYGPEHERRCLSALPQYRGGDLPLPITGDVDEYDIMSFTFTATAPRWGGLLKPCALHVFLQLDDDLATVVDRFVLLPTDGSSREVLLSASDLDQDDFLDHFRAGGPRRHGRRVKRVTLRWRKLDLLSPQPTTLEIRNAAVIGPSRSSPSER